MAREEIQIPVSAAAVGDPGGPRPVAPDRSASLATVLDAVRRWGWLVGALGAVAALGTALVVLGLPREYSAHATMLLEPRFPHVLDMPTVRANEVHDELRYIRTQYEVLQSRALAERVIRDEGLRHEPALGGRPADEHTDWSTLDPGLVGAYLGSLWIEPIAGTRLINVGFTSSDPAVAARVANAHAEAFVDFGHRQWADANQTGLEFLRGRLVELRDRLESSEAALNTYRWETGIIALDDRENVVVEELDGLIKRVSKAEAERLALEADVHALDAHGSDALQEVVEHAGLHELSVHLALAEADWAKAAARFKPSYPGVVELRRKVEALRARVARETRRVEGALRGAYAAAVEREAQMRVRLDEQKTRALKLKDESVHYAILTREVETNRQLYDSVLRRTKEMAVASELRASNVTIVDRAAVPSAAVGPARARSVGVAAIVGLLLGILLVLGVETFDPSVKTPEQAERAARLPLVGTVPEVALAGAPSPTAGGVWELLDRIRPASRAIPAESLLLPGAAEPRLADAYRSIRTSVLLARPGSKPRTLLVASALAGEGKTTTAINLAAAFAQTDCSVLLVDANLREPACDVRLGLPDAFGLADVLAGRATLDDAIVEVRSGGLAVLPAGEPASNPSELLGSEDMQALLASAAERFDYVVIDSPAVLDATDAVVLSTLVDGVVLVARDRSTPRPALAKTRERLAWARAPLLGIVLNAVEERDDPYGPLRPIIQLVPDPPPARARAGRRVA